MKISSFPIRKEKPANKFYTIFLLNTINILLELKGICRVIQKLDPLILVRQRFINNWYEGCKCTQKDFNRTRNLRSKIKKGKIHSHQYKEPLLESNKNILTMEVFLAAQSPMDGKRSSFLKIDFMTNVHPLGWKISKKKKNRSHLVQIFCSIVVERYWVSKLGFSFIILYHPRSLRKEGFISW